MSTTFPSVFVKSQDRCLILPLILFISPLELPFVKTPETQVFVPETLLKSSPGCSNFRGAGSLGWAEATPLIATTALETRRAQFEEMKRIATESSKKLKFQNGAGRRKVASQVDAPSEEKYTRVVID